MVHRMILLASGCGQAEWLLQYQQVPCLGKHDIAVPSTKPATHTHTRKKCYPAKQHASVCMPTFLVPQILLLTHAASVWKALNAPGACVTMQPVLKPQAGGIVCTQNMPVVRLAGHLPNQQHTQSLQVLKQCPHRHCISCLGLGQPSSNTCEQAMQHAVWTACCTLSYTCAVLSADSLPS